jgi:hypothetical protein
MNINDKILLLQFIVRTSMYIPCVDENNVISFIHGYECNNKKCNFTNLLSDYMGKELKINKTAYGWPGQIKNISLKRKVSWVKTFKQISLEIIFSEDNVIINNKMIKLIKSSIVSTIIRIKEKSPYYLDKISLDEWNTICLINRDWFKKIWSENNFQIIKLIKNEITKYLDNNIAYSGLFCHRIRFYPATFLSFNFQC